MDFYQAISIEHADIAGVVIVMVGVFGIASAVAAACEYGLREADLGAAVVFFKIAGNKCDGEGDGLAVLSSHLHRAQHVSYFD